MHVGRCKVRYEICLIERRVACKQGVMRGQVGGRRLEESRKGDLRARPEGYHNDCT